MSNPFARLASQEPEDRVVEVGGEVFNLSAAGVSLEDKFAVLFPTPTKDEQLADHLSVAIGVKVPDFVVASARAILAAYVPPEGGHAPDISDVVRMAFKHPAAFAHLEMVANEILGLSTATKTVGGLADWNDVYRLLRTAHRKGGDPKLIRDAALIAKAALTASNVDAEPLDAEPNPLMESFRGNSEEASSDGS